MDSLGLLILDSAHDFGSTLVVTIAAGAFPSECTIGLVFKSGFGGRTARLPAMDERERLIELIYEGVANEEFWQELLAVLADWLNTAGVGLGLQDMVMHAFSAVADEGIDRGLRKTSLGSLRRTKMPQTA